MKWFINHNQIPHHLHINKASKLISSSLLLYHIFLDLRLCLHLSYLHFSTPLKTLRTKCSFDLPCTKVRIFPWLFCLGPRTHCSPLHQAEMLNKSQGKPSCKAPHQKGLFLYDGKLDYSGQRLCSLVHGSGKAFSYKAMWKLYPLNQSSPCICHPQILDLFPISLSLMEELPSTGVSASPWQLPLETPLFDACPTRTAS